MNEKTCQFCRWWRNECCEDVDIVYENGTVLASDFCITVRADDDSGLDAWLKTGPNFGCVKFQSVV